MTTKPAASKKPVAKKSGIKSFAPGEVLFHESDNAVSLYIIQKGQVRLYRPKGRGFVDIAILRSGEVIGEMAYFDEKNRKRSCSAASIVNTEVIEISFEAFAKTMQGLNPWFKTIINTLADRLRKTNEKVKQLETNSVSFGQGGKVADYVFFHTNDVMKMMSVLHLVIMTYGERRDSGMWEIHKSKLRFYMFDIFNISEIKYEEFTPLLKEQNLMTLAKDDYGILNIIQVKDPDALKSIVVFMNTQRRLEDDKKINVSAKCERFLSRIIEQLDAQGVDKPQAKVDISVILSDFKERSIPISEEDLKDAIHAGLAEDILVGEGNQLSSVIVYDKLKKIYPSIMLTNAIKKINESKVSDGNKTSY